MKRSLLLLFALSIFSGAFAAFTFESKPALKADKILIPIANGKVISLLKLSTIERNELEDLTGKRMNFIQRIGFKTAQKKLRDDINVKGELTSKKYERLFTDSAQGATSGFHLGGLALGFLLGPIGVLIAYLLNDDLKKNRVKWSWIGFAISFVLGLGIGLLI